MLDGTYHLRASPALGLGGMYMTSNGLDKVVTTVAQVPPYFAHQKWRIVPVPDEKDIYYIYFDPSAGATEQGLLESLALQQCKHDRKDHDGTTCVPHGPLIVSTAHQDKWIIFATTVEGVENAYIIKPVTKAVGMNWFVGTEGNEVVIKAFPITEDTTTESSEVPYWKIA